MGGAHAAQRLLLPPWLYGMGRGRPVRRSAAHHSEAALAVVSARWTAGRGGLLSDGYGYAVFPGSFDRPYCAIHFTSWSAWPLPRRCGCCRCVRGRCWSAGEARMRRRLREDHAARSLQTVDPGSQPRCDSVNVPCTTSAPASAGGFELGGRIAALPSLRKDLRDVPRASTRTTKRSIAMAGL